MTALNTHFRHHFPTLSRDAIYAGDLPWFAALSSVKRRDIKGPRKIKINVKVPGSAGKTREEQIALLKKINLKLCDPAELAIATAAYACKTGGKDLLKAGLARTSIPGFVMANGAGDGLSIGSYGSRADREVFAAGD
jgi:hypothetical protein